MMTGRPSSEHGVLLNRLSLRDDIPTIGAWMRSEAGYKTWYAGKWHIVGRLVHTDFEIPNRGTLFGEASDLSVLRSFEGKLSQYSEDTPFFAVVSLLNPHDIAEWVKMEWPRAEVSCKDMGISDLPEMPPNFMTQHPEAALHKKIRRNTNLRDRWSPMKWQFYLWWYYRQVEMVDGVLNRLLDLIWNSRYGHNTVVMLTSDHGDLQGEHGLIMKQSLYEAAARVPLMVAWPGVLPQGTVDRKHLVSGLDVVPTICDFAGIAPPPKTRGASLRGLLKKTPGTWREFLQIQSAVEGRMIRTERYKHIQYRNDAQEQLFLLQEDPWELQDLSADSNHQGMRATMQDLQRQAEAELEPTTLSTSGYGAAWAATR